VSLRRRWPWLALALVLAGVLAVGWNGGHGPTTLDSRTRRIAADIRCPTCSGQSAADSDAPTSQEIRALIRERLQQGQSTGQIKAYLVSKYGPRILLRPATHGVSLIVWVLPVVAVAAAAAGLGLTFWRRRAPPSLPPSDEDRQLVEQALGR
jgi:cytochrome c-type biogenesis protein CcmH